MIDHPDESPSTGSAGIITTGATAVLWIAVLCTAVLCTVVVAMGAIASARGWIPTGDDAFLSLRTRHVLSSNPILLNNASSAGPSAGSQYNHPGAFPLTLLTPITMIGGPGSLALATALLNAAWIALVSLMVRRIAGPVAQLGSLLVAAALVWSMGATLLVDPWNPNFGIWPVATLVVAAWGVRRGSYRMLPIAVLAASVAFQTHLSLTVLAAATAGWALLAVIVDRWRARSDVAARRPIDRALAVAVVVGIVANAQMLADQFFGSGNLGKILEGTGFKEATVSVRQIAAVVASKLAIPPMWFRGSWSRPVLLADVPSAGVTVVGLVVVVGLTVAAVLVARGRVPQVASLFGVLAVAAGSATIVATKFPLRVGIPLPYFRWVWPLAAIWTAAVLAALISHVLLSERTPQGYSSLNKTGGAGVLVVAVALLAFIPANEDVSPNPEWAQDISRDFSTEAIAATRGQGPVLIEQSIQEAALWVIPALMDQLDAAGVEVRATDAVLVQQTDDAYRSTGGERQRLVVRGGLQIDDAPEGARLLARSDALTAVERIELADLIDSLGAALDAPGAVRLTAIGAAETDAADLRHLTTGELPARELLGSVPFHLALERDAVEVVGVDRSALRRASELGARDGGRSIALYLVTGPAIGG